MRLRRRRPLHVVRVALAAVGVGCAGYIVHGLLAPLPELGEPIARPAARPAGPPLLQRTGPPGDYAVVATANLFSPSRNEAAPAPRPVALPPPGPKPFLFGVVMQDENPIAYLQDPVTKRVAAYRVGDAIAGGTIDTIAADRVVLKRLQGTVDVLFRDPARPRSAAAAAEPGGPAAAGEPRIGSLPRTPPAARRVLPGDFRRHVAPATGATTGR